MSKLDSLAGLTRDQAEAMLAVHYAWWSAEDITEFLDSTQAEQVLMLKIYQKDVPGAQSASFWDVLLKIVGVVVALADVVIPVTGAVQAVYSLGKS